MISALKKNWGNFIFYWPCISLRILANNQLDALFHVFIYLISLHVSSITVLIIRRSNCINTSSGMISLCKWLLGMPVYLHTKHPFTQTNHTRWCINTIRSPDDEHCDARNMKRDELNKYVKKCVKLVISKIEKISCSLVWKLVLKKMLRNIRMCASFVTRIENKWTAGRQTIKLLKMWRSSNT